MWSQIINILVGIWLMASPDILNYSESGADSNHIVGPIIASISTVACWEVTRGLGRWNLPLGLWLLAAPWILDYANALNIFNDIFCGAVILTFALIKSKIKGSYGGGWAVLWRSDPGKFL